MVGRFGPYMLSPLGSAQKLLLLQRSAEPSYASSVATIPNLLAYWKLTETSGTNAANAAATGSGYDGSYVNSPTLASTAGPGASMGSAPLLNGTTQYVNVASASLGTNFGYTEGTMAVWCKVSAAGVWTDGGVRVAMQVRSTNDSNRILLSKSATNNTMHIERAATTTAAADISTSTTGWFHVAITWKNSASTTAFYYNGSAQTPVASSPAFAANSLSFAHLGAYGGPLLFWSGYLAHAVVYTRALTAAEILTLATAV